MKVLQINCVYMTGSTGKIVYDIHSNLIKSGHSSYVCYGRGKKHIEDNVFKVSTEFGAKVHSALARLFGVQFGFSRFATAKAIRIIKKINPDVVHLHCLNGNFINVYKLLEYLKKSRIKTILTVHAEIFHTAGCDYALECDKWTTGCTKCDRIKGKISRFFRDDAKYCAERIKKSFAGFEDFHAIGVSDWITSRAQRSHIMQGMKFSTILNGIDTKSFCLTPYDDLRKKHNIPENKKIILHVTPNFNNPIKGGKYVIEIAKRMPEHQFIIVGFNGDRKILPENIIAIGGTNNKKELAAYYSMADVTLLTSQKETFSMIVAETLCCGTPIVGFEAGAPETITIPEYSAFVEQGNVDALIGTVNKMLATAFDAEEVSKKAIEKYAKENMANSYIASYLKEKNER